MARGFFFLYMQTKTTLNLTLSFPLFSSTWFTALDLRALQLSLVEGFQEIIARITTCYFGTKEPLGIPKEEDDVVVHRHQYGGIKNPLTELGVGSAAIRSGVKPQVKDSEQDPDHFFLPSHNSTVPHKHHSHHSLCHLSGTSSPPLSEFRGAEPRAGPEEEDQGKQFTLIPIWASCGDNLFFFFWITDPDPERTDLFVESQTPDADVNFNDSCPNDAFSSGCTNSSDAGTLSDDDGFAVSPSYGSSLTSVTSMASLLGKNCGVPGISDSLCRELEKTFLDTFWHNTTMDAEEQVRTAVNCLISRLLQEAFRSSGLSNNANPDLSVDLFSLRSILPDYRASLETACLDLIVRERKRFLTCPVEELPTPGLVGLGSRHIHGFVRKELGIGMHGIENLMAFNGGLNSQEATTGEKISLIYDVSCYSVSLFRRALF